MKPQIKDILQILESFAPSKLAEKWDNVGLLVGNESNQVLKIIIGLDPTNSLLEEALATGADTVITHHPVIFKPLASILTSDPAGRLLQKALANNISIIGCHTNLDSTLEGVNDVLANGLGLQNLSPLEPSDQIENPGTGLGRIGTYPEPISKKEFTDRLFSLLDLETLSIAGTLPDMIEKIALCGGSGSDFASIAYNMGADVYLSAEIKHATAIWANEVDFCVIDGTHYSTEKPATKALADKLDKIFTEKNYPIEVALTETERHPFVSLHNSISKI